MKFTNLETAQVKVAIKKINTTSIIEIIEEGLMPEADVLLCRYKGKSLNIKIDLAYGAEICPVDSFSPQEIKDLEDSIVANVPAN
ncbi:MULTISPECIES: hypothetical protein [Chromobacterium]|uniref:Uncharacterized protein n=1 Tax=Chromobacterium rhizoryzae TaxID=1778675 RepID=A0AAD0RNC0_9NEIS|nr:MULTISPECIES: hypothetical protein [Chromobacterium]AXT45171.1 hypothetical protein D1345_02720 [Chromobacterium rhizoryzae]MDH0344182.1 hypothetical protein [Chromobacterium haemolyticum]